MIPQSITIHVPENIYQRLQNMAQSTRQSLESVACQSIQGNLPPLLEDAPREWREDAKELHRIGDAALMKAAGESLPGKQWERHEQLLEHNRAGTLTDNERKELENLRTMTDRFVFRRSYALALLKWRGQAITSDMEI